MFLVIFTLNIILEKYLSVHTKVIQNSAWSSRQFSHFLFEILFFVFLQETTSYTGRGKTCTGFLCRLSCKKLFSSSSCYQNLFTFLLISILWFSETLFPQTVMQRVLCTGCLEEKYIISNYLMYSLGLLNSLLPFGMVSREIPLTIYMYIYMRRYLYV